MDATGFIKERVDLFKDFTAERIKQLVDGSLVRSFETNEALAHQGAEATHSASCSGKVAASAVTNGTRQPLGRLKAGETFGEDGADDRRSDARGFHRRVALRSPAHSGIAVSVDHRRRAGRGAAHFANDRRADEVGPGRSGQSAAALRKGDDPYGLKLKGERPEKILVINCGSSSLKYSFYDTADESRHARGLVERIGLDGTRLAHRGPKGEVKRELPKGGFADGVQGNDDELTAKETGVISGAGEVSVVAHRVVHGGEKFTEGTLITDEVLAQIEALNPLARCTIR